MTVLESAPTELRPSVATSPRLWGLSVTALHDAYWRARGVQCIRRGERTALQRHAELFLLLPADQLVLFDLAPIAEWLRWHDSLATRLRLIDPDDTGYAEHVITDDRGHVLRIERRYGHRHLTGGHIVLTARRRLANIWMTSPNRREAWRRIRRAVPWSRVHHGKITAHAFDATQVDDEHELLHELIARWAVPSQALDGIHEVEPGVWARAGVELDPHVTRIGPMWIDGDDAADGRPVHIGPIAITNGVRTSSTADRAVRVRDIGEIELVRAPVEVEAQATTAPAGYGLAKRALDVTVSLLMLAVLWPVMLVIALLIMLEDGRPVFFAHKRRGRHNRRFPCLKFRTMHRNAEELARQLARYNVCDGPQVFIHDDPRVTRLGKFLRRTSLDELPQLINVLVGEMSLVGPRPSPEDENQYCPAWRDLRLSVRPGITGLWQIRRTRTVGKDFQEWIRFDIEYVQRANFWLDLRILAQTARMVLFGRGG